MGGVEILLITSLIELSVKREFTVFFISSALYTGGRLLLLAMQNVVIVCR